MCACNPMITPTQLLHHANQLCRERHNHSPNSTRRECFQEVFEDSIAEAHPEMKHGDVFELVQEWRMAGNTGRPYEIGTGDDCR